MMCYLRESPSPFIIADNDHDTDRLYTSHQFHIAAGVLQFCSVAAIAISTDTLCMECHTDPTEDPITNLA